MEGDYDFDDDEMLDFDDSWLYVEDGFDLADELAEGQIALPGYSGTNYEIDAESFEFELFDYWEDLEYADDAYWDSGRAEKGGDTPGGQMRKRQKTERPISGKRTKSTTRRAEESKANQREAEPLLFCSREERNLMFSKQAPLLQAKHTFSLMADWRKRFKDVDGEVSPKKMPAAMRRAAEAKGQNPRPIPELHGRDLNADEDNDGDGDDREEGPDEEDGALIDPDMLKAILRERLGAAGLDGLNETTFMDTIQKMMAGAGDDAADDLAEALLGKATSDTGDEAVAGWLSQQGVSMDEEEHSTTNVATGRTTATVGARSRMNVHVAPVDSAVTRPDAQASRTSQLPLHAASPSAAPTKKRPAPDGDAESKRQKQVKFDIPSSPPGPMQSVTEPQEHVSSHDPLVSGPKMEEESTRPQVNTSRSAKATRATSTTSDGGAAKKSRKRKAESDELAESKTVGKKKIGNQELQSLGPLSAAPSPAPPAKRTRSARAKNKP